jgi:hypothetical protein
MEPVFLTLEDVLQIHAEQIDIYGGTHGIRDLNGLESAVATPQASFRWRVSSLNNPRNGGSLLVPHLPEPPVP